MTTGSSQSPKAMWIIALAATPVQQMRPNTRMRIADMATTVGQKSQRIKTPKSYVVRRGTVFVQPITFRSTTRRPSTSFFFREPNTGEIQGEEAAVDDQL